MFSTIKETLDALKAGKFAVVFDDQNRENEGDLILAAEKATPEALAFMIRYTSGLVCVPMMPERLDALHLPLMTSENSEAHRTAFTISVDCRKNTSSGISAADRATTIKALIDPETRREDLNRPGHVFPLRYTEGGVLKRAGHTEAAVDLMRLAGLYPAGIICELVNDNGSMMRLPDLQNFAQTHQLPIMGIADLIRYRRRHEKLVGRVSEARLPTKYGEFTAYVYRSELDQIEHLALVKGDVRNKKNTLVRVHSECLTGDIFGSLRCDCGSQLDLALQKIAQEGSGALIYLRGHEGRGIGLAHKLRAYQLQDNGKDTVEANVELGLPIDSREYGIGAQILNDLGMTTIRLMTNNPAKYSGLTGYDLEIVERIPLISAPTHENIRYLKAKKEKLGHLIEILSHNHGE
jgi:3,4-dihydroxy 2-butanone 4-phosphate synthase/GTP cyclohydrolase II